jgi:predicted nucleic acid-binding protein
MRKQVYIETSVVSYLAAWPSRDILIAAAQEITRNWWNQERSRYELFVSELVRVEASRGDPDAAQRRLEKLEAISDLKITSEAVALANHLVDQGAVPREVADDATHVAVAAVHGMDYLLTWNFRHIDNAETKPQMRSICAVAGYPCPEICTPQELMGADTELMGGLDNE